MIGISTVTPVYAGEDYLEELVTALRRLQAKLEERSDRLRLVEAIFVLDEPADASVAIIRDLRDRNPWIRIITLSRNFGQHNATVAGILHSSGDWVVTLDEDLQHSPEHILDMLFLAARQSADVVLATPQEGSHGSGFRDLSSRLSKKLIGGLSQNRFIPQFSSFRLMRGEVARATASVCSHQTYFDAALVWFTSRVIAVPMKLSDQRYLASGKSGYSFLSLLGHAKRLVISSDIKFLNISMVISAASFIIAVLLESWVLLNYLINPALADTQGWASLISVMLFFGGVLSLLLGFVLEIVKANMFQGQGRPTFYVVDRCNDDELTRHLIAAFGFASYQRELPGEQGG